MRLSFGVIGTRVGYENRIVEWPACIAFREVLSVKFVTF
jgi:hypothetical protein